MIRRLPLALLALLLFISSTPAQEKPIRVGIIGLDTSHAIAFTGLLNDPGAKPELANCRVVAVYPQGIHGVETLFTVMGTGCESVTRTSTPDIDVVVGKWKGGRVGTFRGIRKGKRGYGGTAFGSKGIGPIGPYGGYRPLVVEIVKFFRTGQVPVSAEETLEIYAFMEAADESKRQGGAVVTLRSVMEKARKEARERQGRGREGGREGRREGGKEGRREGEKERKLAGLTSLRRLVSPSLPPSVSPSLLLRARLPHAPAQRGVEKTLNVAIQYVLKIRRRESAAGVFDPLVGMLEIAANL